MPTIRKYSQQSVDADLLKTIIEAAQQAPTTGNMQLYTVIATDSSSDIREALNKAHFNQPAATGAPVLLTVCADFNRFTRWCKLSNAESGYDNFVSFTSAFLDAAIFAQQIVLEAEKHGLGTCYLGTALWNADQISTTLNLPELVIPIIAIAMGYPAEEHIDAGRLPVDAIFSTEKYPALSDEEIINIYKETEEREDSKRFVAENDKATLAQVFTDVRYPKGMNEEFSAKLLDVLSQKGFLGK